MMKERGCLEEVNVDERVKLKEKFKLGYGGMNCIKLFEDSMRKRYLDCVLQASPELS